MEKNEGKSSKCSKYISFGKCYKKMWLILLGVIILYIAVIILFILFDYKSDNKKEMNNIINFMSYLFFLNLGESLMLFLDLILKKKITSKNDDSSNKKEELNRMERYIFNKISIEFSKKEKYISLFLEL